MILQCLFRTVSIRVNIPTSSIGLDSVCGVVTIIGASTKKHGSFCFPVYIYICMCVYIRFPHNSSDTSSWLASLGDFSRCAALLRLRRGLLPPSRSGAKLEHSVEGFRVSGCAALGLYQPSQQSAQVPKSYMLKLHTYMYRYRYIDIDIDIDIDIESFSLKQ